MLEFLPLHIHAGFSFASDFFYHHIGTKYDEATMTDPLRRIEMEAKQQKFLPTKYPRVFNPKGDYRPRASLGIGVATIPKIFGCKIKYADHMNPVALPLLKVEDNPLNLKEPQLEDAMQWLYCEVDQFVEAGYKKNEIGLPDLQGELNIAVKLLGDDRMLGLIARKNKEDVVRHILDVTSDAYIHITQALRKVTNRPLISNFSIAGCTYFYLSPQQWTKFILPVIKKQEILGKHIRIHHCGLANSEKIEAFAQYPWSEAEFGFGSDLKRARELFIHKETGPVSFSCRVSPYRMLNQSATQITEDVNWIIQQAKGGPMSINVVGIPYGTPDANIHAMLNAVENFNIQKEREMEEED